MAELFNEARVLIASRKVNADRKSVKPRLGRVKRTVENADGHFSTETVPGELTFKLAVDASYDPDDVDGWIDKPVQVEDINMGAVWQSESMTTVEQGEPDKGWVQVKMAGRPFRKLS